MSDDIDRLKRVLEQMAVAYDTLKEDYDVMRDVVNAVQPINIDTDPEGHSHLRDLSVDISLAYEQLARCVGSIHSPVWDLKVKTRS
jgi:hypothetical protein